MFREVTMGYPSKAVANAFLDIAREHGATLTPLKLQKLVYIAHGWSLGLTNSPLVADEHPEAWQYGPVFPGLYHEFKEFGKGPISKKATELNFGGPGLAFDVVEPEVLHDDKLTWSLLRRVWDQYGKFGGIGLSELTHKAGTPWEQIWSQSRGIKNADIPDSLIQEHYKQLRDKNVAKRSEGLAA